MESTVNDNTMADYTVSYIMLLLHAIKLPPIYGERVISKMACPQ